MHADRVYCVALTYGRSRSGHMTHEKGLYRTACINFMLAYIMTRSYINTYRLIYVQMTGIPASWDCRSVVRSSGGKDRQSVGHSLRQPLGLAGRQRRMQRPRVRISEYSVLQGAERKRGWANTLHRTKVSHPCQPSKRFV